MTADEIKDQIIQKMDEYINHIASPCYCTYCKNFAKELASLRQQLEECKEDQSIKDDIDLAYCAGIWNTGGIDVLSKELERLKHIDRKPHQIFQRYKQATNIIAKVKEAWTPNKRSFEEAEAEMFLQEFIIWKDLNAVSTFVRHNKNGYWLFYKGEYYTLDKLYLYWLTEIKNKKDGKE